MRKKCGYHNEKNTTDNYATPFNFAYTFRDFIIMENIF